MSSANSTMLIPRPLSLTAASRERFGTNGTGSPISVFLQLNPYSIFWSKMGILRAILCIFGELEGYHEALRQLNSALPRRTESMQGYLEWVLYNYSKFSSSRPALPGLVTLQVIMNPLPILTTTNISAKIARLNGPWRFVDLLLIQTTMISRNSVLTSRLDQLVEHRSVVREVDRCVQIPAAGPMVSGFRFIQVI